MEGADISSALDLVISQFWQFASIIMSHVHHVPATHLLNYDL